MRKYVNKNFKEIFKLLIFIRICQRKKENDKKEKDLVGPNLIILLNFLFGYILRCL